MILMPDSSAPLPQARSRWPYVLGCGLAMGAGDVVPAVSGGSMALIMGICGRQLEAVAGFDLQLLRLLGQGRWVEAADRVHLGCLIPLLARRSGVRAAAGMADHLAVCPAPRVAVRLFLRADRGLDRADRPPCPLGHQRSGCERR